MLFKFVLCVVFGRVVWLLWKKRKLIAFYRRIGSKISGNPVVGHLSLMIGDDEKRMTAFRLLGEEAIKQGGLTMLQVLHRFVLVVADSEIADVIFKNCLEKSDIMHTTHNLLGNGSIFAPVSIWRPRRKLIAPAFAQKNLIDFVHIFDKCSRAMIEEVQKHVGKEPFSVWKYVTAYTMDATCETNLGIEVNVQRNPNHPFLLAFGEYCKMTGKRLCSPWLYNDSVYEMIPWYSIIRKHISFMWEFVDDVIKTKRVLASNEELIIENFDQDKHSLRRRTLLELLMKPSRDAGYTDLELREELLVVTIAATDTSATGAAFVLAMLARSSSIRERVQQEVRDVFGDSERAVTAEDLQMLRYLDAVVRETLRLYPPVPVIVRTTDRNITLPTGIVVPKDCDILLNLWAIHRNPRFWGAAAEEFKPERFLNEQQQHHAAFVPFSFGPRSCLGNQYAMMSMKTVVCNLLRHFDVRHPDLDEPVEETSEPMRVKFDIMMKDVNNWRIRLDNKM